MDLQTYLEHMKKFYQDTERQFLEFTYTVPIDEKQKLYSPRLYNMLQFTCSQVDSLMKKIVEVLNLQIKINPTFQDLFCLLNDKEMLEGQKVLLWETEKIIQPFSNTQHIIWWLAYNSTKHGLPIGIKKATMNNVINALAGSYVLNGIIFSLNYTQNKLPILERANWGEYTADSSTMNNLGMLREYQPKPFLSKFFTWLFDYHPPSSHGGV